MKIREYTGSVIMKPEGGRVILWPEIPEFPNCKVEVEYDGAKATMKVYEPEPNYEEIKALIFKNVGSYSPGAFSIGLVSIEELSEYRILNVNQLAEFIKRFFIDGEGQDTFPCKY